MSSQSEKAGFPIEKDALFHSTKTKITTRLPVLFLEYFTMGEKCFMVIEPGSGIHADTLRTAILDSDRMMNPFEGVKNDCEIVRFNDEMFVESDRFLVEIIQKK